MKAAIIAGGLGTRIRGVSGDKIPKALIPVAGEPLIVHQLLLLARYGVEHVTVLAGHLGEVLQERILAHPIARQINIQFHIETQRLGTAGGLTNVRESFDDDFFVLYGDMCVNMDLRYLMDVHKNNKAILTLVAHPNDHPLSSDLLRSAPDGRLLEVMPLKTRSPGNHRNLVPAGVYVASLRVLDNIQPGIPQDFIKDVVPEMLRKGLSVHVYNTPEYLKDMGTPERWNSVEKDMASGLTARKNRALKRPAVFFDLDGVINQDVPVKGLTKPSEVRLLKNAAKAVRLVNSAGWLAVAVTNRPQLAKGFLSPEDLEELHGRLEMELGADGAWFDRIYYCPHHPERGFPGEVRDLKIDCDCRKPKTGMIQKALGELPVDLALSCLIGDSKCDIELARAMKIPALGVATGNGCANADPDKLFADVFEAVDFAISKLNKNLL